MLRVGKDSGKENRSYGRFEIIVDNNAVEKPFSFFYGNGSSSAISPSVAVANLRDALEKLPESYQIMLNETDLKRFRITAPSRTSGYSNTLDREIGFSIETLKTDNTANQQFLQATILEEVRHYLAHHFDGFDNWKEWMKAAKKELEAITTNMNGDAYRLLQDSISFRTNAAGSHKISIDQQREVLKEEIQNMFSPEDYSTGIFKQLNKLMGVLTIAKFKLQNRFNKVEAMELLVDILAVRDYLEENGANEPDQVMMQAFPNTWRMAKIFEGMIELEASQVKERGLKHHSRINHGGEPGTSLPGF